MCTKFRTCGRRHIPRWKVSRKRRNHKGQFVQGPRTLTAVFLGVMFVGMVSMIGVNTIMNSIGVAVQVDNAQAEIKWHQPTWQEEVLMMVREAGLDADLANRIIQHESWWDPDNSHLNKDGSLDRGLWMINNVYHPEVSDDCAYDWFCSTREAIRIAKSRGWGEWIAYKHGYVK